MYAPRPQGQFSSCAVNTALMSPAAGVRRVPGRAGQRRAGRDETTNRRRARDDRLASDTQGAARMIGWRVSDTPGAARMIGWRVTHQGQHG